MAQQNEVRKTFSFVLPISLVEEIKAAARLQAIKERRHVAYSAIIREALEREFRASPAAPVQQ